MTTFLNKAKQIYNKVVNGRLVSYHDGKAHIIGGFAPASKIALPGPVADPTKDPSLRTKKMVHVEEVLALIQNSDMPHFEKTNACAAISLIRQGINAKGEIDEKLLTNETCQAIIKHLSVVSGTKPKVKPLVQPSTRPAAKAPLPAPAPKPVVKKKPLAQIKHAIYCDPNIPIEARSYAIQAAEIRDRFTNQAGILEESKMSTTDHWTLRRAERMLKEKLTLKNKSK